jgi:hypothetical protein
MREAKSIGITLGKSKFLLFFLIISFLPWGVYAQEKEPLAEEEAALATPRLPMPRQTELAFARQESKQEGVKNSYYKYYSSLKKEEILDFYRNMFSSEKGYKEERRGLPDDDSKRNHFFFMKGSEEMASLGLFYDTEAKKKITYFVNITKIDFSKLPKPPKE